MKAIISKDLIIGITEGDIFAPEIPIKLQNLPINRLRFNGKEVVDATTYTTFYIDKNGIKHIIQFDSTFQELKCNFDNELINDNDSWRVKTPKDYLQNYKQQKKAEIKQAFLKASVEPVTINNILWNGGFDSAIKINGAIQLAQTTNASDVTIYDYNNQSNQLTIDDAQNLAIEIGKKYQSDLAKKQTLYAQIENATTKDDIDKIVW